MLQKILAAVVVLIGLIALIFPFTSGDQAYFIGDSYYINLKDSVDQTYDPYINSLVQQDLSKEGAKEKKRLRELLKPKADSLETCIIIAQENKDGLELEKLRLLKRELQTDLIDQESAIDDQFSITTLSSEAFQKAKSKKKENYSQAQYLVAIGNEIVNPSKDEKIKSLTPKDIQIHKVNQQSTTPFVLSGTFIILCGVLIFAYQAGLINLANVIINFAAAALLSVACVIVGVLCYFSFADRLAFDKEFASREIEVKEKLLNIKELQLSYFEAKNKYCNNWESLIDFAKNDSIKIVKYLVNKDDSAAVNKATREGLALEDIQWKKITEVVFSDKKINLDEIARVPYSKDNFELNAGIVNQNDRKVHVFEVKTLKYNFVKNLSTLPENFDKKKALILGSMTEPSTEGNW